jgi:DegV family protein with EDD domain
MDFKTSFDSDNRLRVIDTKAASGRLGLIAITTARYSLTAQSAEDVAKYALRAIDTCEEYIFLERLHYLAAGGRISPTSAFFGDMLNMKPVVTPVAEGAKKVAMVRNLKEQLQFIFQKMEKAYISCGIAIIMLEYSDNEQWVSENLKLQVQQRFPEVEILLRPFSLTSGAHTGPGTWAVAFLPKLS